MVFSRPETPQNATAATAQPFRPMSAASVRQSIRQGFAATVANIGTPRRIPAQPFRPVSGSTWRNRSTVPACQSIRQRRNRWPDSSATYPATVRQSPPSNAPRRIPASVRQSIRQAVAVRRPRRIPANVCRILPAARPTVGRLPCNRGNRSTLARLNRAENGLASRPPFRPCPRPSETRRAFCKPSAPCLQRNQRRPSAGSGQGFRRNIERGRNRGEHRGNRSTVRRIRRQPIRQHRTPRHHRKRATVRRKRARIRRNRRQASAPDSSPVHRKRPCKPSARSPMSAPV